MRHGVTLRRGGAQAEQISCPFHGTDNRPSAKYFPDDGDSASHVWCFVCHENWDAIGLWKKFTGTERFGEVLWQLERAFGLTTPESPLNAPREEEPLPDPIAVEVEKLLGVCEQRLREHRESLEMTTHLRLGSLLDHTRFYFERKQIDSSVALERLGQIARRILLGRSCAKAPSDS